jgi:hypothetical protein
MFKGSGDETKGRDIEKEAVTQERQRWYKITRVLSAKVMWPFFPTNNHFLYSI